MILLAERRVALEDRLDPNVKSSLEKRIAEVEERIKSHEAAKPPEIMPPGEDPATADESKADVAALQQLRLDRETVTSEVTRVQEHVIAQQLRAAQANKLLDKIKNLEAEFERRKAELADDAAALDWIRRPWWLCRLIVHRSRQSVTLQLRPEMLPRTDSMHLYPTGSTRTGDNSTTRSKPYKSDWTVPTRSTRPMSSD